MASQANSEDNHPQAALARELDEIELLLTQARTETERHEARRRQAAERVETLLGGAPPELREAHQQLLTQTQRAALMSSQIEVLEGKQKVLRRYAAAMDGSGGEAPAAAAEPDPRAPGRAASREVLAAQEELRRAIARQMHDGPAQSLANIALQAAVVERLVERDPGAAKRELDDLRRMVQNALDVTKTFIFDVRPMVLDDLGLVPTLRRAARERAQRSRGSVELDTRGQDRRLEAEIESSIFRILDDALAGYLAASPRAVSVHLDWLDDRLVCSVVSEPPPDDPGERAEEPTINEGSRGGDGQDLPPALADMIAERAEEVTRRAEARRRGYGLPDDLLRSLRARADSVDVALEVAEDGLRLDAVVAVPMVAGKG